MIRKSLRFIRQPRPQEKENKSVDKYWFVIRRKEAIEPKLYGPFSTREQLKQSLQAIWAHDQVYGDDPSPVYSAPNEAEAKEFPLQEFEETIE